MRWYGMSEIAINVSDVTKIYKLYDRNRDRLIDSFGLSKKPRYKEHYALNKMSFQIKKGETVGIIGTNGAGKSTILKIITGVLNPTEGDVEIDGRISALLELGAGFNPEYTGIENIYLNGTMMGFSKEEIENKMEDILNFADIGEFVYQPVKSYSSGMFVRLAFAVAINIEPEKRGKTILFVSHDLGSISRYCDRVILLNKGTKLAEGTPKEIIGMYKRLLVNKLDVDEETKQNILVDNSHMNDINAQAEDEAEETTWKDNFALNPNVDEYGNGMAQIIDFAVRDSDGIITGSIEKGTDFRIISKVKFEQEIQNPIFTYTIKNLHGTAITGTNSMFEHEDVGTVEAGSIYTCTFSQQMSLQGGEYLLSISCTGYRDGEFVVYHRLYDVINITVISDSNTVGFFDMGSKAKIEKVK